jgi:hypothetical protein
MGIIGMYSTAFFIHQWFTYFFILLPMILLFVFGY